LWVFQTAVRGGIREVFILGDLRIRISLEQIEDTVVREPVIEASVSAETQMTIDALGKVLDVTRQFGGQVCGFCDEANLLLIIRIPLKPPCGDIQGSLRKIGYRQLPRRVSLELAVANDTDADFASFNVLFGKSMTVRLPVDKLHAFGKLLIVIHNRRLQIPTEPSSTTDFTRIGNFNFFGRITFCPIGKM
jgi:hypothetical protein